VSERVTEPVDERVSVDVRASDLTRVHEQGLTAAQALALVADVEWSDEILQEVRDR